MNKFMQRIYSAMEAGEDQVIDQISSDIDLAKKSGNLDSEEYQITANKDDDPVIHDKVHDEYTKIKAIPGGYELEEVKKSPNEISVKRVMKSTASRSFSLPKYAVIDESGKLKYLLPKSNAEGVVSKNPGWKCIPKVEYVNGLQEKLTNFSEIAKNKIINNILSAVENCN